MASSHVHIKNSHSLELFVRDGSDVTVRERVFLAWYREELRKRLAPLIDKWAVAVEIPVPAWGIKRMKTKWGTCKIEAQRIWLNLELIKKPPHCLEYVVVHEMAHFIERRHSARFVGILDKHYPNWRSVREELNHEPLADENWT